jgi:hypothetical protein
MEWDVSALDCAANNFFGRNKNAMQKETIHSFS